MIIQFLLTFANDAYIWDRLNEKQRYQLVALKLMHKDKQGIGYEEYLIKKEWRKKYYKGRLKLKEWQYVYQEKQ